MSPLAAGWFRVGVGFISDSWGSAIHGSWGAFPTSWNLTPDFLSQSECLYEEIGFSQCHFQAAMSYSGAWGDSFSLYGSEGFGSLE